jgi:hypothetical protein
MKYVNLFKSQYPIPANVRGCFVKFESLSIDKQTDRRAFLQSIVGSMNRKGYDAAVAPDELAQNFDITILNIDSTEAAKVLETYSNLGPKIVSGSISIEIINKAWQNKVRTEIMRKGFLKIGDRYVLENDIRRKDTYLKRAYRIQATIVAGFPSLWIDPRTRFMIALRDDQVKEAESMGDESEIKVRVLPSWSAGILIGRTGKIADNMEFPLGRKLFRTTDYWRIKHGVNFVDPKEEMLEVYVSPFGRTLPYPRSCVFEEFKERTSLPEDLKKVPETRIIESQEFIKNNFSDVNFLGQRLSFEGPIKPATLGYTEYVLPSYEEFFVVVGSDVTTSVSRIHAALTRHGPYSGTKNGKYIVIHFGMKDEIQNALRSIEQAYSKLNLGKLELYSGIGDGGFIDTGGKNVADYTSAIAQLRSQLMEKGQKVLVIVVLPDIYSADVYFKSRGQLFERIFGTQPFPVQAIAYESIEKIMSDRSAYAISVNTASQCYIKFGGTGTAVWILKEPADCAISGITPGSSCYAYHDVSRRRKIKASATAYSAMTDSYGRYIATGTRPIGGEKLTPSGFYDILVELIQKVSMFEQRYMRADTKRLFSFRRLVFAKDGVIRDDEAQMMEDVMINGIEEERKEPIPNLLKRIPIFPKSLVLDIIGVNKTPNKRIFEHNGKKFINVKEGTAISYSDEEGLIVSCMSPIGTAQPIEISLKKHIGLNIDSVPKPHIKQIMDEYYRLTRLNWSSIFKQGKYALPQILTQNLGENISAGVSVPDDMILL